MYSKNAINIVNFALKVVDLLVIKNVLHVYLIYYILIISQGIAILIMT